MKCGDVKRELALRFGNDSDNPGVWDEVRRHVSGCAACRVHYRRLKESMAVLEQADPPATYEVRGSLWPEIEKRLDLPRRPQGDGIGRSWLPMLSVAVACLLFVSVWVGGPIQDVRGPVMEKQMIPLAWPGEPRAPQPNVEAREADKRAEQNRQAESANL